MNNARPRIRVRAGRKGRDEQLMSANSPGSLPRRRGPLSATALGVVRHALDRHLDSGPGVQDRESRRADRRPSPTEPQLTNSTPPCSRTHGLWVCPKTSTSASSAAARRSYSRRLVLEQVLVDLARRAVHEVDRRLATSKRRSNGRSRMKSLAPVGVASVHSTERWPSSRSCGVTYAQPQSSSPGDRVVVVAVDRRDPILDQRADLVRVRAVADQVAAAVHALDAELLDPRQRGLERREVGVDVGDHRDGRQTSASPGAPAR